MSIALTIKGNALNMMLLGMQNVRLKRRKISRIPNTDGNSATGLAPVVGTQEVQPDFPACSSGRWLNSGLSVYKRRKVAKQHGSIAKR